jgi:hypothetical protein
LLGLAAAAVLGLAAFLAAMAGFLSDPRVAGTPQPTYTPPRAPAPAGADQVAELLAAAWTTVAGSAEADWVWTDQAHWQTMADTLAVQWRVLTGPDPLGRVEGEGTPGTPVSAPSEAAGVSQADAALAAVADAAWGHAAAAAGVESAWWAGLAGAADQLRYGAAAVYAPPQPIDPLAALAVLPEEAAFDRLADASHAAVYTASTVLGWLPRDHGWRATVAGLLDQLRGGRDDLQATARANGWAFPTAAAAYAVPPLDDGAAPLAILDQAAAGLAQAAVAWVAAAPPEHRDQAVAAARWAAGLSQGHAPAVWFGWPD